MADTTFTCLGMSGAGKTCYILGLYDDMCIGRNGFLITAANDAATKLERWMDVLDDGTGMERFPTGTPLHDFIKYTFNLSHHRDDILSFDWFDYGGGTLRAREENPEIFKYLNSSIEISTALYIFVDGELLCDSNKERRIRNVQRKCARTINQYIKNYSDMHKDSDLPPVIFVITKMDLCRKYINEEEMRQILKDSFSSVFGEGITSYIVPVSLGKNISDDNYSGEVDPINIHIPIFIGIYHQFLNICRVISNKIENANKNLSNEIDVTKSARDKEKKKIWIFKNKDRIKNLEKNIQLKTSDIESNNNLLKQYNKLLKEVGDELLKNNSRFNTFVDGRRQDFRTETI